MNNQYDVIVIGAGIGGLTAAAILAKNGKRVLVLEKNSTPGGYMVCFQKGKFKFDASLHLINGCNKNGPTYKILEKCGVTDKIQFLKPHYLYRSIFPDFDMRIPQSEPREYIAILTRCFPLECKGIKKLFKRMSFVTHNKQKLIYSKISSLLKMTLSSINYRVTSISKHETYQSLINNFLKDPRLKAAISQLWSYFGLPPSKLPISCFKDSYSFYRDGGYYPKGGSQAFLNTLQNTIKHYGGEIILNCEVREILINRNLAKGVKTNKGIEFIATDFISNIDARNTFLKLISSDYYPESFREKISQIEPSVSALQIYLGLNVDLREREIFDYEIFVNPNYDLEKQFKACIDNNIIEVPFIITIYSNLDDSVTKKGKTTMSIVMASGYDFWKNLPEDQYKNKKLEVANQLIKRAEQIIPNLSAYIEEMEVATPITMERYTGNYKGAIYGWSNIESQSGIKRLGFKNPYIKNIYLASAWTQSGGGVCGTMRAGERAAEEILGNKH